MAVLCVWIGGVLTRPSVTVEKLSASELTAAWPPRVAACMLPAAIFAESAPLVRNPNGKIDRKLLTMAWAARDGDRSCAPSPRKWLRR